MMMSSVFARRGNNTNKKGLFVLLLCSAVCSYDVELVSFDKDDCAGSDIQYEITVASGSCLRGPNWSMSLECTIDNVLTRVFYKDAACTVPTGRTAAPPVCDTDSAFSTLFGGTTYTQVCQNTDHRGHGVDVTYHSSSSCDDSSLVFGATVVPSTCYNPRTDGERSMRYSCAEESRDKVYVELWNDDDRCGGLMTQELSVASGACLPPGHAANAYSSGTYVRYACPGDGGGDWRDRHNHNHDNPVPASSSSSSSSPPATSRATVVLAVFAALLSLGLLATGGFAWREREKSRRLRWAQTTFATRDTLHHFDHEGATFEVGAVELMEPEGQERSPLYENYTPGV